MGHIKGRSGIALAAIAAFAALAVTLFPALANAQAAGFCHTFGINLRRGDNGSEVIALQQSLELNLGYAGHPLLNVEPGTFGDLTFRAVVRFQEKYRADILTPAGLANGNGIVATRTRAKLNQLYGCQGNPPLADQAPRITGVSIPPRTIVAGMPLTLSWSAWDPDGDNLAWSISWGTGPVTASVCPAGVPVTAFSASHTWTQPGTYVVRATVTDCKGGSDSATLYVTVTADVPASDHPGGSPVPSPATSTVNHAPIGNEDVLSCSLIAGWSCDPDSFSAPLSVVFYMDRPIGQGGTLVGSTMASMPREAGVGQMCGGNAAHGFYYTTPFQVRSGTHPLYTYAIDHETSSPVLIGSSPRSVTCTQAQSLP